MTQTLAPAPVAQSTIPPSAPAVERAFQLGWSLAELKGRVAVEAYPATRGSGAPDVSLIAQALTDPLSQDLWRGSMWRVAFDRVSSLQTSFPTFRAVPKETLYDPGERLPDYLFPNDSTDYASTGALWPDDPGNVLLPEFRLREATRRALNCLDLLYLEPERTMRPDEIKTRQTALLAKLAVLLGSDQTTRQPAIVRLTQVTLTLLDTWDAYLREQFADAGWTADSEHNLIAYEAGRALASLSWDLSRELQVAGSNTAAAKTPAAAVPDVAGAAVPEDASTDPYELAWQYGFSDRNVSYLQHMLAVLGQALDRADSSAADGSKRSTTIRAVIRSVELWQRSVLWLCDKPSRVLGGLGEETIINDDLRVALIEQSAIWQALVLGQEDLSSYTAPAIAQRLYMEATIKVEQAINPAELGAVGAQVVRYGGEVLNDIESAVHDTLDKVVNDATLAASQAANSVVQRFWPWLVGVGVLFIVLIALVYLASPQNPTPTVVNAVGGLFAAGLAFFHLKSSSQQATDQATRFSQNVASSVSVARTTATEKFQDARSTVSDAIGSARTDAQTAATAVTAPGGVPSQLLGGLGSKASALLQYVETSSETALSKAQGEVQNTVQQLESVIAITYPLIDYVIARTRVRIRDTHATESADSTFNFLQKVVWTADDTKQELLQVASAAFGPLGVIALASVYAKDDDGHTTNGVAH